MNPGWISFKQKREMLMHEPLLIFLRDTQRDGVRNADAWTPVDFQERERKREMKEPLLISRDRGVSGEMLFGWFSQTELRQTGRQIQRKTDTEKVWCWKLWFLSSIYSCSSPVVITTTVASNTHFSQLKRASDDPLVLSTFCVNVFFQVCPYFSVTCLDWMSLKETNRWGERGGIDRQKGRHAGTQA